MTATVTLRGRRYRYDHEDGPGLVDAALGYLEGLCIRETEAVKSPDLPRCYLRLKLATRKQEVFAVMFLDARFRVIECREMFTGTINGASVFPREVVRAALETNAVAVILGHNHPSGDPTPSSSDVEMTQRLKSALELVDVHTLDHIVVGTEGTVSLKEQGLM